MKDADSEADDSVGDVQPPVSNVTPNVFWFLHVGNYSLF